MQIFPNQNHHCHYLLFESSLFVFPPNYYTEPRDEEILNSFLAIISHDSPVRTQETPPFQRK